MADPNQPVLILTHQAREVRASLEPLAWLVLEELGLEADRTEGQVVADQSARVIGATLGRSKDSVARALRQLVRAELIQRLDERHYVSGRFLGARYVIDLAAGGLLLPREFPGPPPSPAGRPSTPLGDRPNQLDLIDP